MALQSVGLQTYIWNNNLKSILLLLGFPLLLLALTYALLLLYEGAVSPDFETGLRAAAAHLPTAALVALGVSGAWFAVAWAGNQAIIDAAAGSREVTRTDEPDLYNLLENLAISRGMPTPRLRIIETPARNAFASGLSEKRAVVTVTRGLLDALDTDELQAVLAHELSHIINRDSRLLVIAAVFVGIISLVGQAIFRNLFYVHVPRTGPRGRREGGGQAGALVLLGFAIIALSYLLAIIVRFALSRRRELLADAGSVELTKDPRAMIDALLKISGHSEVRAPSEVREMFIDNPASGFTSLFATHPPIEVRIEALRKYAGGSA